MTNSPEMSGSFNFTPELPEGWGTENHVEIDIAMQRIIESVGGVPYRIMFGLQPDDFKVSVGKGITNLLGISPEEFSIEKYMDITEKVVPCESGFPVEIAEIRKKLASGEINLFRANLLVNLPQGEKKWIFESTIPVKDQITGKIKGITGILFDSEKLKNQPIIVEKSDQKTQEIDEVKMAFLRNLFHEVRTPLNAIIGFSTFLEKISRDNNSIKDYKEYIEIISQSSEKLLDTLDKIVEASLLEAGEVKVNKEAINVNEIMKEVYDRLKSQAFDKGLKFLYHIPFEDEQVSILTDRYKLLHIIMNLVENAIKFTEKGEVEYGYVISGEKIDFYVSDTGNGIPEEYQNKIYDVFFQSDSGPSRLYGGTGLGLSITKAYVELLGGKIWYFSEPGSGTTFFFSIPFERL